MTHGSCQIDLKEGITPCNLQALVLGTRQQLRINKQQKGMKDLV